MINLKSEILNSKKVTSQRFKAFCILHYGISLEAFAIVLKQANLSFRVKGEIFYNQLGIRFLTPKAFGIRNDNL